MVETGQGSRVGSRFGRYHLRRLLGRGGMGEVYEAHDTVKDRVVALKLMSAQVSSDPVFRERMQREAYTAGRLQEPHVVPIHDYGEIDGQLFIDMRFIEGTDVGALLDRYGPLPPPRAVAIVRQVAAALDAAHADGVMHRDIKPENILITGDDFAYLVDFGIASAITQQRLTQTGVTVGTWSYMAPERFGSQEVTYRADIYALACVLHEMLTGSTPYRADSHSALMAAHLFQPIPRPSQLRPGIPAAFDEVIARGMAKDPADRYARAGDLAVAAHQALSTPDQDQAVDILQRSQQSSLLAPGPPPPPPWQPGPPPMPWQPAPAPPPPPGTRTPWIVWGTIALVIIAVLAGVGIWLGTRPPTNNHRDATTNPTTPTTPPPAPTVPPDRLDSILLSTAQISTIMDAPNIQAGTFEQQPENEPLTLSDPNCRGVLFAGPNCLRMQGSGYSAMSARLLQEPQSTFDHWVYQGAVAFPSADQADAFVKESATKWTACAGQTVVQTLDNNGQGTWNIGNLTGEPPKIAMLNIQPQGRQQLGVSASAQRGIQRGHRRHCCAPRKSPRQPNRRCNGRQREQITNWVDAKVTVGLAWMRESAMVETGQGSRVGSRFGRYHLRRLLGRGGMGEVYEAHDTVKDRVVALKLMSHRISSDPVFRERMQREAYTAGRLQEPHVVPIHDYGEIDGQLFIDMRFIEGTDVGALLTATGHCPRHGRWPLCARSPRPWMPHTRDGVMHRDIKPENILITGDDFAYLVDFGIASAITEQRLTKTGVTVGTWNYMAPERFGNDEVTYRADIYALACVLHEC